MNKVEREFRRECKKICEEDIKEVTIAVEILINKFSELRPENFGLPRDIYLPVLFMASEAISMLLERIHNRLSCSQFELSKDYSIVTEYKDKIPAATVKLEVARVACVEDPNILYFPNVLPTEQIAKSLIDWVSVAALRKNIVRRFLCSLSPSGMLILNHVVDIQTSDDLERWKK